MFRSKDDRKVVADVTKDLSKGLLLAFLLSPVLFSVVDILIALRTLLLGAFFLLLAVQLLRKED